MTCKQTIVGTEGNSSALGVKVSLHHGLTLRPLLLVIIMQVIIIKKTKKVADLDRVA